MQRLAPNFGSVHFTMCAAAIAVALTGACVPAGGGDNTGTAGTGGSSAGTTPTGEMQ